MALLTGRSPDSFIPLHSREADMQALWHCMERLATSVTAMEERMAIAGSDALQRGCGYDECYHAIARAVSQGSTAPSDLAHVRDLVEASTLPARDLSDSFGPVASSRCSASGGLDSSRPSSVYHPPGCSVPLHAAKSQGRPRQHNRHCEGDERSSSTGHQPCTERLGSQSGEDSEVSFVEESGAAEESDSSQGESLQALKARLLSIRASLLQMEVPDASGPSGLDLQALDTIHSPLRPLRLDACSPLDASEEERATATTSNYIWEDKENMSQSDNQSQTKAGSLKLDVDDFCTNPAHDDRPDGGTPCGMDCVGCPGGVFDERVPQERPRVSPPPRSSFGGLPYHGLASGSGGISGNGVSGGGVLGGGRKSCPPRWWGPTMWSSPEDPSHAQPAPQVPQERPGIRPTQTLPRPSVLQRLR